MRKYQTQRKMQQCPCINRKVTPMNISDSLERERLLGQEALRILMTFKHLSSHVSAEGEKDVEVNHSMQV